MGTAQGSLSSIAGEGCEGRLKVSHLFCFSLPWSVDSKMQLYFKKAQTHVKSGLWLVIVSQLSDLLLCFIEQVNPSVAITVEYSCEPLLNERLLTVGNDLLADNLFTDRLSSFMPPWCIFTLLQNSHVILKALSPLSSLQLKRSWFLFCFLKKLISDTKLITKAVCWFQYCFTISQLLLLPLNQKYPCYRESSVQFGKFTMINLGVM